MLRELTGVRVYLACGYTDLRGGIDKLAGLVQQRYDLNPFDRSLYLFCGRKRDRIKGLLWEGDGFLLLYKRYESGGIQWPRKAEDMVELSEQQYRWLMEGLSIVQPKALTEVKGKKAI